MWKDPIVAEIRRYREEYAARLNYDLDAICDDLQEQEKKSGAKVISLQARRAPKRHRKKGKPAT